MPLPEVTSQPVSPGLGGAASALRAETSPVWPRALTLTSIIPRALLPTGWEGRRHSTGDCRRHSAVTADSSRSEGVKRRVEGRVQRPSFLWILVPRRIREYAVSLGFWFSRRALPTETEAGLFRHVCTDKRQVYLKPSPFQGLREPKLTEEMVPVGQARGRQTVGILGPQKRGWKSGGGSLWVGRGLRATPWGNG